MNNLLVFLPRHHITLLSALRTPPPPSFDPYSSLLTTMVFLIRKKVDVSVCVCIILSLKFFFLLVVFVGVVVFFFCSNVLLPLLLVNRLKFIVPPARCWCWCWCWCCCWRFPLYLFLSLTFSFRPILYSYVFTTRLIIHLSVII